ncbi:4-hydroxy-tetrahydrodipicolinate reductase [bacterium]|nr:4-hydroxy-tetrahydrodipicolinate reductase [bacterium]
MSEIRVLVNGARGKMGATTVAAVRAAEGMTLVAETDLGDALADAIRTSRADVVVDFTHPGSVFENCRTILSAGAHGVIGTTGLSASQLEELSQLCARIEKNLLVAPNFAIGAILMMRFAAEAAPWMDRCEIIERHHDGKADAPSGTALKTAELVAAARADIPWKTGAAEKETLPGSRGGQASGLRIHSVRLPGYLAHQEVVFGAAGQTLVIRHDSLDRNCFMPGVILAVRKVAALPGLTYGLERLLFG